MVSVAEWLMRQIVVLVCAGSIPVGYLETINLSPSPNGQGNRFLICRLKVQVLWGTSYGGNSTACVYILGYLLIGFIIISTMNYALDGLTAELDDPMMIFLVLGWPFVLAFTILFFICIGIHKITKIIGVTIYNLWN